MSERRARPECCLGTQRCPRSPTKRVAAAGSSRACSQAPKQAVAKCLGAGHRAKACSGGAQFCCRAGTCPLKCHWSRTETIPDHHQPSGKRQRLVPVTCSSPVLQRQARESEECLGNAREYQPPFPLSSLASAPAPGGGSHFTSLLQPSGLCPLMNSRTP